MSAPTLNQEDLHFVMSHPEAVARAMTALRAERDAARAEAERLRAMLTSDNLAQIIRTADGNHDLGAGALGEAICAALASGPGA